jgi:hypothetical protein
MAFHYIMPDIGNKSDIISQNPLENFGEICFVASLSPSQMEP